MGHYNFAGEPAAPLPGGGRACRHSTGRQGACRPAGGRQAPAKGLRANNFFIYI